MAFSVEIASSERAEDFGKSVEIHIDKKELAYLIEQLNELCNSEVGEHLHFFSELWGTGELDDKPHVSGNFLCHHLKINLTSD